MKKRPLTLIEVFIATMLLSIILFFLLSPFRETAVISNRAARANQSIARTSHLQTRLSLLFAELGDTFLVEKNALHFTTAIGVDPDPAFSAPLSASLFLRENNLYLELWPKEEAREKHSRTELLATNIETLTFEFFQLEEGKFSTHKTWGEKTPPECCIIHIDDLALPFTLARKTGGIAL